MTIGADAPRPMPPRFRLLIAVQAASALADNASLIVAIALLQARGLPGWWAPLLKFAFTLSYVFLAPLIGPLADAMPKARLMVWMNTVKLCGVAGLMAGLHPVAAFAVIGFGAAAYAPAKYGLVTEMVGAHRLVAANAWIEVSVVCAALLGTIFGGLLVADGLRTSSASLALQAWLECLVLGSAATDLTLSMVVLVLVYALSGLMNLGVPDSGSRYPATRLDVRALLREFDSGNRLLWRDRDGGLSLAVTTIFWGVGATLQFVVLRWAAEVLALDLEHAAYLQAAVAIGVIAGATWAGRRIRLSRAKRVLPAGIVLGLLMPVIASTPSLVLALPLLALVGAVGGVLVVPLNALLQHRGHALLSAGRSIAIQGFNENLSILVMVGGYAVLTACDVPIVALMWGFGLAIAAAMALLMRLEGAKPRRAGVTPDA
ncbi:lysophospholipid transporter LplT [Variovorax brevis]|uniref:lysophospholipid transporter LplT n=1 Tax=Variovorax brevis TaxID=3053503 RepID=UPI002574DA3F|nr:lysophospholipid transporter LplT [Variovorax sp. J22R133]